PAARHGSGEPGRHHRARPNPTAVPAHTPLPDRAAATSRVPGPHLLMRSRTWWSCSPLRRRVEVLQAQHALTQWRMSAHDPGRPAGGVVLPASVDPVLEYGGQLGSVAEFGGELVCGELTASGVIPRQW